MNATGPVVGSGPAAGEAKRRSSRWWLLLAAPLVVLALFFLVPLPAGAPAPLASAAGRTAFEAQGSGPLLAGAGLAELAVPSGGPIGGYPAPRRDQGAGPPLAARALLLRAGDLEALVVSLPVLLISPDLEREVLQFSGLGPGACLLLAATHTHSGPGGYWQSALGVVGATGAFSEARRTAVAAAAVQAITRARAALVPARLEVTQADWPQGPAAPRGPHALDPALTAVQARDAAGTPLGTLAVYGMHPTVIPRAHRSLSGDWPEAAARALEQAGSGPALVLQGAGGDATWPRGGASALGDFQREERRGGKTVTPDEAEARALGALVARRVLALLSGQLPSALAEGAPAQDASAPPSALATSGSEGLASAAPLPPSALPAVRLACSVRVAQLPAPEGGRSLLYPLRTAATNLLRLLAPRAAVQTTIDLPGLRLLGVPGEPVGELGLKARAASTVPLAVIGLADGYAGYAETRERAERGEGESSRTWHGPGLAAALGLER